MHTNRWWVGGPVLASWVVWAAGCGDSNAPVDTDPASDGSSAALSTSGPATDTLTVPTTGNGSTGDTTDPAPTCGDGVVDPGEACDDGAGNGAMNSCTAACTAAVCGDGLVGPGEGCDDANKDDDDECTSACALATCGDGVVAATEQCDDANKDDTDACTSACTAATCSDGFVQPGNGETCDEGATNSDHGDGKPFDADGGTEACDDGVDNGPMQLCTAACTLNVCGDGDKSPAEQCDDANQDAGDGCSPVCALEGCGNSVADPGESCDDGQNGDPDDGCTDACQLPACGDGFTQPSLGEQCDDGGLNSDSGACTTTCQIAQCGDSLIQDNVEQCDDGPDNGAMQACNTLCLLNMCGDGDKGPGETCDDGNQTPGDGCDPGCGCKQVNGLLGCYNPAACGQGCNAVCAVAGKIPVADKTVWLQAQDTAPECQSIATAFGFAEIILASFTYACLEDEVGDHANSTFVGPLYCSTFSGCPQNHVTLMDQAGVPCGPNSRRSICPCE